MEPPFPVISPYVFLNKALWVEKARDDIEEVNAVLSHIALPLHFIPFKPHSLQYGQSVCTVNYFGDGERLVVYLYPADNCHA